MTFPGKPSAVSVIVLIVLWGRLADAYESNKCAEVSKILGSCYGVLRAGEEKPFMRVESVCCKSLGALEQKIEDHRLSRYEICECLKGSSGDNQTQGLMDEKLLEVYVLCGPRVPFPVTSYSDCSMLMRGNVVAADIGKAIRCECNKCYSR